MRILVTGKNGQLGQSMIKLLNINPKYKSKQHEFIFVGKDELDLADKSSIDFFFNKNKKFDIVVNCAAYTSVDKAEEEEELANLVNHLGVKYLAESIINQKGKLIHISTDYVFDGESKKPYDEMDKTHPINVYGKTKLMGERAVQETMPINAIIIRTSWLYSEFGENFLKTILRLGKEKNEIHIVNDQIGSPTYASDLADTILKIVNNSKNQEWQPTQIYHYSNIGDVSWYSFAKKIFELGRINCKLNPITTKQFPRPALRPKNSVMKKNKIMSIGISLHNYDKSIRECLSALKF